MTQTNCSSSLKQSLLHTLICDVYKFSLWKYTENVLIFSY